MVTGHCMPKNSGSGPGAKLCRNQTTFSKHYSYDDFLSAYISQNHNTRLSNGKGSSQQTSQASGGAATTFID